MSAYIPNSGSVVAFQSQPSSLLAGVSVIGLTPVSVTNFSANQSVSGTVVTISSGSIAAAIVSGSIAVTVTPPANQSVSGTVGASIIGAVPVTGFPANQSVSGTVFVNNGSVVAFQGTSPWVVNFQNSSIIAIATGSVVALPTGNQSISGTVITNPTGTIVTSIVGGASVFQTGTWNVSITSTLPSSVQVGASIFGQLPAGTAVLGSVAALQGTNPWITVAPAGSVMAVSGVSFAGSVIASNTSSVIQQGTWNVSITSTIPSSVIVGASIFGALPAGNAVIGGVAASISGVVNIAGSVIGFQGGTQITSIAGAYATGAASIVSGLGVLTLGLRNDSLASIYGTNATYTPITIGPAGEQIIAFGPLNQQVTGIASCFTGVEQPLITSVAANYIYVTGVQVANASANNVYLSFYGAGLGSVTGSIIGFTVAPANGGSNITYEVPLKTAIGQGFSASVSGVASVFIAAQGFLSKT